MRSRKKFIFTIVTIIIIGGCLIFIKAGIKSFVNNLTERKQLDLKDAQGVYTQIAQYEKPNVNVGLVKKIDAEINGQNEKIYNNGVSFLKEGDYESAIVDLRVVTGNLKEEAAKELKIATPKYINEVFNKIQPLINARHYLMAYEDLQGASKICENNAQLKNKLKEIKGLESKNIGLTKATDITMKFLNENEVNIQAIVGDISDNYVTYSYPTGKVNFIIKEQNGSIDGENGFLFLVKQMENVNGNFSKMNGYFYVFVNMDSGKAKIYDESILNKFKSTFKISEFNVENPTIHQFTKEFTESNCFALIQQFLQEQDGNNNFVSGVQANFNEQEFINKVPGYKEIYNEPHQLFLVNGEKYYVITQEEIYEIQGNKLLKGGKPKFPEVKVPREVVL